MEELENKKTELQDVDEAIEEIINTLSTYQDYKKEVNYLKKMRVDIKYDIELTQEDINEQKEEESKRQTEEYNEYIEECQMDFNKLRI